MTAAELKTLLETTDLPVAYRFFEAATPETVQAPPFIVFYQTADNSFYADNKRYYGSTQYNIELVTKRKDITKEQLLETALANIPYTKSEEYIDGENCNQVTYEIEV